jgi:hypothetical protein
MCGARASTCLHQEALLLPPPLVMVVVVVLLPLCLRLCASAKGCRIWAAPMVC